MASPICEVLSRVAGHMGRGIAAWSYRDDFDAVWALDDALDQLTRERHGCLVWDSEPPGGTLGSVNIARHATPFDWCVAISLRAWHADGRPEGWTPPWSIQIFDMRSGTFGGARSVRLLRKLQESREPALPWVRFYRPLDGAALIKDLAGWKAAPGELALLEHAWQASLTSVPEDRHAIANLVDPIILMQSMSKTGDALPALGGSWTAALGSLMQAIGLAPEPRGAAAAHMDPPWVAREQTEGLRFVLFDDMADMGWSEFLRRSLALDASQLQVVSDPQRLDEVLDAARADGVVLVVDLRLFLGNPGAEWGFFGTLFDLANEARHKGQDRLRGAPGFLDEELELVGSLLALDPTSPEARSHPGYFVALTLLPRMLAIDDPTVPIIVFSSTGRREIIEKFEGYGTIILDFDKPRFFGEDPHAVLAHCRGKLRRAVERAVSIVRGRSLVMVLAGGSPSVKASNLPGADFVQVFMDESLEEHLKGFRVGGVALLAKAESHCLDAGECLVSNGIRWGPTVEDPDIEADRCLPKKFDSPDDDGAPEEMLERVSEILRDRDITPVAFALVCPVAVVPGLTDLASPGCLDNLHRDMILKTLEILLYEKVRWSKSAECRVYVASRRRKRRGPNAATFHEYPQRFGVWGYDDGSFQSISPDSVHPIASAVLTAHPDPPFRVTVARGPSLWYYRKRSGSMPKPRPSRFDDPRWLPMAAHFLADIVLRPRYVTWGGSATTTSKTVSAWYESGFVDRLDKGSDGRLDKKGFELWLSACREARFGRDATALARTRAAITWRPSSWAARRLAKVARRVSASDFLTFCEQRWL